MVDPGCGRHDWSWPNVVHPFWQDEIWQERPTVLVARHAHEFNSLAQHYGVCKQTPILSARAHHLSNQSAQILVSYPQGDGLNNSPTTSSSPARLPSWQPPHWPDQKLEVSNNLILPTSGPEGKKGESDNTPSSGRVPGLPFKS